MTRRTPKPRAGLDWRAIAVPPAQRGLGLPVHVGTDTAADAPLEDAPASDADDDVELRLQRDEAGARVTLVAATTYRAGDELRRLAERLHRAADALDGGAP